MNLKTEYANEGRNFIIYIDGKFDFALVQSFREAYEGLSDKVATVVVDFRDTDYIDSSALGMLLNMRKALGPGNCNIHLVNCRPDVRRIFDISRFDKLFVID